MKLRVWRIRHISVVIRSHVTTLVTVANMTHDCGFPSLVLRLLSTLPSCQSQSGGFLHAERSVAEMMQAPPRVSMEGEPHGCLGSTPEKRSSRWNEGRKRP